MPRERESERRGRFLCELALKIDEGVARAEPEHRAFLRARQQLLDDFQLLHSRFGKYDREPGQVAPGPGQARYETGRKEVAGARGDNRDDGGCGHCRPCTVGSSGEDDVDFELREFLGQFWKALNPALGPPVFNDDVLPFDVIQRPQPIAKCGERKSVRSGIAGYKPTNSMDSLAKGLSECRCRCGD